jgi:hypothetical protein
MPRLGQPHTTLRSQKRSMKAPTMMRIGPYFRNKACVKEELDTIPKNFLFVPNTQGEELERRNSHHFLFLLSPFYACPPPPPPGGDRGAASS